MTFRELLKSKDMTASRLSRKIGVSRNAVHYWAHGVTIPKEVLTVRHIAQALDTDMDTVLNSLEETAKNKN